MMRRSLLGSHGALRSVVDRKGEGSRSSTPVIQDLCVCGGYDRSDVARANG